MEIKPIRISNEAELQREIESMKTIFGVVDEWEQRVDNLKKLQQMAQMGLHQSFPNFINYLKDLQDSLSAQVIIYRLTRATLYYTNKQYIDW